MSFNFGDANRDDANDTISNLSYRPSPRAIPRGAVDAEGLSGGSPTANHSPIFSTQTTVSARLPVTIASSGFRSSPTLSMASIGSSRSYRISTETDGDREMTGDEVNALVSSALRRARKATSQRVSKSKLLGTNSSPEKLGTMPVSSFSSTNSASAISAAKTTKTSPVAPPDVLNIHSSNSSPEQLGMIPMYSFSSQLSAVASSATVGKATNPDAIDSPTKLAGPEKLVMMPISPFSMRGILSSHSESLSEQPLSRSPTQDLDEILGREGDQRSIIYGSSFGENLSTQSCNTQEFSMPVGSPRHSRVPDVVVEETNSDITNAIERTNDESAQFLAVAAATLAENVSSSNPAQEPSQKIDEEDGEKETSALECDSGSEFTEEEVLDTSYLTRIGSDVILSVNKADDVEGDDESSEYTEETVTDEDDDLNNSDYTDETIDDDEIPEQGMEVELVEAGSFDSNGEIKSRALTGSPTESASSTPQAEKGFGADQVLQAISTPKNQFFFADDEASPILTSSNTAKSQTSCHEDTISPVSSAASTPKVSGHVSPILSGQTTPKSEASYNEGPTSPLESIADTPKSQNSTKGSPQVPAFIPRTNTSKNSKDNEAPFDEYLNTEKQSPPEAPKEEALTQITNEAPFDEYHLHTEKQSSREAPKEEALPQIMQASIPAVKVSTESPQTEGQQQESMKAEAGFEIPLKQSKKELWWTSPPKEVESVVPADDTKAQSAIVTETPCNLSNCESVDENIDEEVARSNSIPSMTTKQASQRFPSPQIVRCETTESKKENSPPRASSPISIQSSDNGSFEELEARRYVSENAEIEFRHPYPLPPPIPRPRSTGEISRDFLLKVPDEFKHWIKPKPELEKLLCAIHGSSLARRSNACGAMKVLSMKKKNQMTLVRTQGFLDALAFAISTDIPQDQEEEIARDARGRAVTSLLNVSEPKDNRIMVFTHPGVADALVKVIKEDQGEARVHACGALGMLAKTPLNRQLMINIDDLVTVLAKVLVGTIDDDRPSYANEQEKGDDDDSDAEDTDGFGSSSFSSDSVQGSVQESVAASAKGSFGSNSADSESVHDDASLGLSSAVSSVQPSPIRKKKLGKSIRRQKKDKSEEFLEHARTNACAALSHLSKHCSISNELADNDTLLDSVVKVSKEFENPIHTKCIEILCNFSRFPSNTADMARNDALVNTILKCGKSKKLEDRIWALRTIQNVASDSASKVLLANSRVLTLLSICAMRKDFDEQVAAVAGLYNLSTEPGAVVPLTNTRNVVATLVHLAHNTVSRPEIRNMACDALATIGLWLQTLAGSGKVPPGVTKVLLPSHSTTGWDRWD